MEPTKKRRGSLLRNIFAAPTSPSFNSPNKKARAEAGLTKTTLRLVSCPDEPKPAFTVFQTRMLKVTDGKEWSAESGRGWHYGAVEVPKAPVPTIRVIKPDGIPFVLKEEEYFSEVETMTGLEDLEYTQLSEGYKSSISSIVPTPLPTPPESPVEDGERSKQCELARSGSRASSLSRTRTIQSRKNSLSRAPSGRVRNGGLHRLDTLTDSTNPDTKPSKHVHSEAPQSYSSDSSCSTFPPSPPTTPPSVLPLYARLPVNRGAESSPKTVQRPRRKEVPSTSSITTDSNTLLNCHYDEKIPVEVTIMPGSIIGGDIHPYFRRYDKALPSAPINAVPDISEDEVDNDASSISSVDSFSSMSSFSSIGLGYTVSEGNEDSIVGTRDSMSTVRESWLSLMSVDEEKTEVMSQKEAEAQEARMRRMREMAVELEKRGAGAGTLKWGGMGIGNGRRIVRKPVSGSC